MKTCKSLFCIAFALAVLIVSLPGCGGTDGSAPIADASVSEASTSSLDSGAPPSSDGSGAGASASGDGAAESGGNGSGESTSGGEPGADESATDGGVAFSYSGGIDENGFWDGITALDYVEMYDYHSFAIPSDTHNIPDEELQTVIDSLLQSYSSGEQITDRAVVDGDTVNIDYVGSVGGVEFDGGSTGGSGTEVTIGVTSYIDDFLEQLIGHSPGDAFDINVTFPEDYGQENLNGKDAVFATTVNYIVEASAPELTDGFVAENLLPQYGWNTVEEMKDGIYGDLRKDAIQKYIQEYWADNVTVKSVPDALIQYQESSMIKYFQDYADSSGMGLDEYLSSKVGFASLDELVESNREYNTSSAKNSLIVQAVAEDAGITASVADVADYFASQPGLGDYSQYEGTYGMPYLKQAVLTQEVMDFLMENCVLE
jgi:trigger factor